jgi:hypothetical protein
VQAAEPVFSARYLRMAEASVSLKLPSSSTGTCWLGLTAVKAGCRCAPEKRSTTSRSSAMPSSAASSSTGRLTADTGW